MPYDEHQLKRYEAILRQARVRALTKEELDFVKAFCQSYFQLLEMVRDENTTIEHLQRYVTGELGDPENTDTDQPPSSEQDHHQA